MLSTSHLGATKTASSTPHEALAADEIPIDVPSDVLHAFIDLLCNGSTASNVVSSAWSHVVDLTLKYDCHIVQRLLGVQLYLMIDIDPWAVFCLATRLNDRRLVTAATAQLHRVPFLTAQPFAFRPPKESYYQSALRDVPLAKWEQISPKWAFQLMKAIIFVEDHKLPSRVDWAEVARKVGWVLQFYHRVSELTLYSFNARDTPPSMSLFLKDLRGLIDRTQVS